MNKRGSSSLQRPLHIIAVSTTAAAVLRVAALEGRAKSVSCCEDRTAAAPCQAEKKGVFTFPSLSSDEFHHSCHEEHARQ